MTPDRARTAAHETVRQVLNAPRTNVTNLRPRTADVYDANTEPRTISADAYEWTLILLTLRDSGVQVAVDLADSIEDRLRHPSAARS